MSLRELMATYDRGFEEDADFEARLGELPPALDALKQRAVDAAMVPVNAAKDRAAQIIAVPLRAAKKQAVETVTKPLKYVAAGAGVLVLLLMVLPSLSRRKDASPH